MENEVICVLCHDSFASLANARAGRLFLRKAQRLCVARVVSVSVVTRGEPGRDPVRWVTLHQAVRSLAT